MTTLHDVARVAGVSISTVSYAMSGTRKVSAETKARVRRAMVDLNYTPNESARSLASKKTRTLSLLIPSGFNSFEGTVSAIINAAAQAALERNYRLLVWPSQINGGPQSPYEPGELSPVGAGDGAILMEVLLDDPRIAWLQQAGTPVVLIGRTRDNGLVSSIDIDFESGVRGAVAKLQDLGHSKIAMINHSQRSHDAGYGPTVRSKQAFLEMRGAGAHSWHENALETVAGGGQAIEKLRATHPDLTAVVVMNERAAFGVQRFVRSEVDQGKLPISIVTVASSPGVSELANPSFASFDAPAELLGAQAVAILINQIESQADNHPRVSTLIPCTFVTGGSLLDKR